MYKALLLTSVLFMTACYEGGSVTYYSFDEKEGEVTLPDLYGIEFSLVCSVDGVSKKCGIVFYDFTDERVSSSCNVNGCTKSITKPGFKDASVLSIQVKNENSGEVQPLLSFFQDVDTYIAGDTYVPSAMSLKASAEKTRSKVALNGFYEGGVWVARDTVVLIGDTLFANDMGLLDFSVSDRRGNKARLAVNLGMVLGNNDAGTIDSVKTSIQGTSDLRTYYCWRVDSAAVTVEPIDINFEFPKLPSNPYVSYYYSNETPAKPFLRLKTGYGSYSGYNWDPLIFEGGVNKSSIEILVVNYAK